MTLLVEKKPPKETQASKDEVWRLKKAMYGLKKSPQYWTTTLMKSLEILNFRNSGSDCLFVSNNGDVRLVSYVDDLLIVGQESKIDKVIEHLKIQFRLKISDRLKFLNINISVTKDGVLLDQKEYIQQVLKDFNYLECRTISTP